MQAQTGAWISGVGKIVLGVVCMACFLDVLYASQQGDLAIPLSAYLGTIFSGVAAQFVGAAVSGMRFTASEAEKPPAAKAG